MMISFIKKIIFILVCIGFFGCMPKIPNLPEDSYVELNLKQDTGMINKNWWESFGDKKLLELLTLAHMYNTQDKLAKNKINAAKAALKVASASFYPKIDLKTNPEYSKNFLHPLYGFIDVGIDVDYHLDIFGKYRHIKKAKEYELKAQIANSYATSLSVDMIIAKAYFKLLALKEQLFLLQNMLKLRGEKLKIVKEQEKWGYISDYDTKQTTIEYENLKTKLQDINLSIIKTQNAIEYLTGKNIEIKNLDSNQSIKSIFDLKIPYLPKELSSRLLNNRPDVLMAEFILASSDEMLKKARKDFLPDFNLDFNFSAVGLHNFTQYLFFGGIAGSILTPIFRGGELDGKFDMANAERMQAAYIYRDVVIKAYQESKDSYASLKFLDLKLKNAKYETRELKSALSHIEYRYKEGYSSYIELLNSKYALMEKKLENISLKNMYLESLINLYGALGGSLELREAIDKFK